MFQSFESLIEYMISKPLVSHGQHSGEWHAWFLTKSQPRRRSIDIVQNIYTLYLGYFMIVPTWIIEYN